MKIRERGARAIQAVFDALDFAQISETEVQAAITAYSSEDMPDRDKVADIKAAQMLLNGPITVLQVIQALEQTGYHDVANNLLEMQRQRVIGDYLQPAAIFDESFHVMSGLSDPNDYKGPGTGYRLDGQRWNEIQNIPQAWDPVDFVKDLEKQNVTPWLDEIQVALPTDEMEVVVAIGPAFGIAIQHTINGIDLKQVLHALIDGITSQGVRARIIRVHHTSDCAFIGYAGAQLSGSGVSIGIQSKGTTVIHRKDLAPLENLELFSMAPNLDITQYRQIGRNAATYAQHKPTVPVTVKIDNTARLRLIVQTTLLHRKETELVQLDKKPTEVKII
jgi:hypothetical protein